MTITLELTPQQEDRLRARAAQQETDVNEYTLQCLHLLDADHSAEVSDAEHAAKAKAMADLMQQWRDEDAAMTPEEVEQAEADWQALQTSLIENRLSLPIPDVSSHD